MRDVWQTADNAQHDHRGRLAMNNTPSPNGDNGRDGRGRFATGNAGGPGNPHAQRVAELRSVLMRAVTEADMTAIIKAMIEKAKAGDAVAARLLLDRTLGPTEAVDVLARLEAIEARLKTERATP
jgi:hypothetical protein